MPNDSKYGEDPKKGFTFCERVFHSLSVSSCFKIIFGVRIRSFDPLYCPASSRSVVKWIEHLLLSKTIDSVLIRVWVNTKATKIGI